MRIFKLRDKRTGKFYLKGLYSTSPEGNSWRALGYVKSALTSANRDFQNEVEVVEYELVEKKVYPVEVSKAPEEWRGNTYKILDRPLEQKDTITEIKVEDFDSSTSELFKGI